MFETIGAPELLIILVVVVLLFGGGKVGRLGKDLGTSVREFRRAIKDDEDEAVAAQPAGTAAREPAQYLRVSAPADSATAEAQGPRVF